MVLIVFTQDIFRYLSTILQLVPSSRFAEDLGLDSLDAVEVVMAIEEVRRLARFLYFWSSCVC